VAKAGAVPGREAGPPSAELPRAPPFWCASYTVTPSCVAKAGTLPAKARRAAPPKAGLRKVRTPPLWCASYTVTPSCVAKAGWLPEPALRAMARVSHSYFSMRDKIAWTSSSESPSASETEATPCANRGWSVDMTCAASQ